MELAKCFPTSEVETRELVITGVIWVSRDAV